LTKNTCRPVANKAGACHKKTAFGRFFYGAYPLGLQHRRSLKNVKTVEIAVTTLTGTGAEPASTYGEFSNGTAMQMHLFFDPIRVYMEKK
jgi:hypothetical protein